MGIVFHMGTKARDLGPLLGAVATELRVLSAERHLGVRALAERSGVPHPTVSKSLNGLRMIDVEELGKLASALGTSPERVMTKAVARLAAEGISLMDLIPGAPANVTPIGRKTNVRGPVQDDQQAVASEREDADETDEGYEG
jgi:transcriptional regulator with XRE-family HTH domain